MTLSQTRQALVEEFHKKYDFSENETLEYDNLIGIADFITKALNDYTESIVRMVEGMKVETDPDKLTHDQVNYEMDWREATNKTLNDIKEELGK